MNKQILELFISCVSDAQCLNHIQDNEITKFAELLLANNVPDGYALVPIEPTPKMVDATFNDIEERHNFIESHNKRNKRIYKAMLSAAPTKPAQASDEAVAEVYEISGRSAVDLWETDLEAGTKLFTHPQPDSVDELVKALAKYKKGEAK